MGEAMMWLIPLAVIYFIGAATWFLISLMEWNIERKFPDRHDPEKVSRMARAVLRTPLWPLELLGMAGRTISKLQQDVMR